MAAAGGEELPKRLDGPDLVMLDQLGQTAKQLTVSCYHKLPFRILGNDKMATPVLTSEGRIVVQSESCERIIQ